MLRGNFLIGIGFKGLRFKKGDGIKDDRGIVEGIEDKVTQDVDLSEASCLPHYRADRANVKGTGTWSTRVSHLAGGRGCWLTNRKSQTDT